MQQNYLHFKEEDFIADEYFQQWVKFPDADNMAFWIQYMEDHTEQKGDIFGAKAFVENLSLRSRLPSSHQVETSLASSLEKIAVLENDISNKANGNHHMRRYIVWTAAAAIFIGCIITGGILFAPARPVTIETVAGMHEIKKIVLPDSSTVTLNAGSHITYASNMHDAPVREVWLDGEAFFDVKHIEQDKLSNRFIVHSGDMDIEVVGTTFNVKKFGSVTNVTLNTGKIKIALKDDPETAIYLQPGDFIRYSSNGKHILKKQVKAELYSVWKEEKLTLDQMPLSEIARLLEDAYGYTIQIQNKQLADSKVSGNLYLKDEATLLQTLAFALDINIEKKDSVLFFLLKN